MTATTGHQLFSMPASFIAWRGSGLAINHFHTLPLRRFSALSRIMPTSSPIVSVETQPVSGLKASARPYLPHILSPNLSFMACIAGMRDVRRDHERAAGGAGHDGAIDLRMFRRTTPRLVALGAGGAGDAPDVLRVVRELLGKIRIAPLAMRARGRLTVHPPIGFVAFGFALSAKIEPCERILISPEQGSSDVVIASVGVRVTAPGVPGIWRKRMSRRSDAQQIHGGELAILLVTRP